MISVVFVNFIVFPLLEVTFQSAPPTPFTVPGIIWPTAWFPVVKILALQPTVTETTIVFAVIGFAFPGFGSSVAPLLPAVIVIATV